MAMRHDHDQYLRQEDLLTHILTVFIPFNLYNNGVVYTRLRPPFRL